MADIRSDLQQRLRELITGSNLPVDLPPTPRLTPPQAPVAPAPTPADPVYPTDLPETTSPGVEQMFTGPTPAPVPSSTHPVMPPPEPATNPYEQFLKPQEDVTEDQPSPASPYEQFLKPSEEEEEKAVTFGDAFGRGVDIAQQLGYSAVEAAAEATGLEGLEEWAQEGRERNIKEAQEYGPRAEFGNISSFGDFTQWAKEVIGEQIPIMAPSLAGGAAGAAAGSLLGPIGATVGGVVGAFVPSLALGVGEVQSAIKEKDSDVEAPGWAFAGGTAIAAFDTVLPGRMGTALAKRFGKETAEEILQRALSKPVKDKFLKRTSKGAVRGMATEGMTEAIQEAISEVTASVATDTPIDPAAVRRQMLEGGAAGALMGGGVGAVTGAAERPAPEMELPQDIGVRSRADEPKIPDQRFNMPGPDGLTSPQPETISPSPETSSVIEPIPQPVEEPTVEGEEAVATPEQRDILRRMNFTDQDIDAMDLVELSENLKEAEEFGITPAETTAGPRAPAPTTVGTGTAQEPVSVEGPEDVRQAETQVDEEPTDAQKEAGNYKKGHIKLHGFDIAIETKKGGVRRSKDPDNPWRVRMPATYGYIKRTEGADGDQIDVFLGDEPDSEAIYLINQQNLDTGEFDEHKVVMGVGANMGDVAEDLYFRSFSDNRGMDRMQSITEMPLENFREWLKTAELKKPFVEEVTAAESEVLPEPVAIPEPAPEPEPEVAPTDVTQEPAAPTPEPTPAPETTAGPRTPTPVAEPVEEAQQEDISRETPEPEIQEPAEELPDLPDFLVRTKEKQEELDEAAKERAGPREREEKQEKTVEQEMEGATQAFHEFLDGKENLKKLQFSLGISKGATDRLLSQEADKEDGKVIRTKKGNYRRKPSDWEERKKRLEEGRKKLQEQKEKDIETTAGPRAPVATGETQEVVSEEPTEQSASDIFDQAFEAEFGEQPTTTAEAVTEAPDERTTEEVKESAKANLREAAEESAKALQELFGGTKLGAGPAFDEETYVKAKPHFIRAARLYADAAADIGELVRRTMRFFVDEMKMTPEAIANMKPYFTRFIDEYRNGEVNLETEETPVVETTEETATEPVPEEPAAEETVDVEPTEETTAGPRAPESVTEEPEPAVKEEEVNVQDIAEDIKREQREEEETGKEAMGRAVHLDDAGYIPWARKHLYTGDVDIDDVTEMSEEQIRTDVVKQKVWSTPDYKALVYEHNMPAIVAYLIKVMYDSLATRPFAGDYRVAQDPVEYVAGIQAMRDLIAGVKTVEDAAAVRKKAEKIIQDLQITDTSTDAEEGATKGLSDPYDTLDKALAKRDRNGDFVYGSTVLAGAVKNDDGDWKGFEYDQGTKLIDRGWPFKTDEPWKRYYMVEALKAYDQEQRKYVETDEWGVWATKAGSMSATKRIYNKDGGREFESREAAEAAGKKYYEALQEKKAAEPDEPPRTKPFFVADVEREGPTYRKDDADFEDENFLRDEFGFYATQWGNWANNKERQLFAKMLFDSFHDLARVLNLPPKAIALDNKEPNPDAEGNIWGRIGIAIGARGKGGRNAAAAHYEFGTHAINLTKKKGAGSLAHEWGHALDHYLGWMSNQSNVPSGGFTDAHMSADMGDPLKKAAVDLMNSFITRDEYPEEVLARRAKFVTDAENDLEYKINELKEAQGEMNVAKQAGDENEILRATLRIESKKRSVREARQILRSARSRNVQPEKIQTNFYKEAVSLDGGRKAAYWSRPDELFARAFEAYVFDKLAADGHRSDYLVQGVEDARYDGPMWTGNPYPSGDERAVIVNNFDVLFKNITTREGARGPETEIVSSDKITRSKMELPVLTSQEKIDELTREMRFVAGTYGGPGSQKQIDAISDFFLNAGRFRSVAAARTFMDRVEGSTQGLRDFPDLYRPKEQTAKEAEETIEKGAVSAARRTIQADAERDHRDLKSVFDDMVRIYESQPPLKHRTSDSIANQAYSTPVPLSYVASRLANVVNAKNVYEPTAGHGSMLIEAWAYGFGKDAVANEIDPARAAFLERSDFDVTQNDATEWSPDPRTMDAVLVNPPFGVIYEGGKPKDFSLDDVTTTQADHAISWRALNTMKDDGRAVLIIGGVRAEDIEERRKGYRGAAKRQFYTKLFRDYNVEDIFTVHGDLYSRQGASFPVDVIVINGRGETTGRKLPAADPPDVLRTWDEIAVRADLGRWQRQESLEDVERDPGIRGDPSERAETDRDGDRPDGPAVVGEQPGAGAGVGTEPRGVPEDRDTGEPDTGDLPVDEPDTGRPVDEDTGSGDAVAGDGTPDTTTERNILDLQEANEDRQVPYEPWAKGGSRLNTDNDGNPIPSLMPASLAQQIYDALRTVESEYGNITEWLTKELDYKDTAALQNALADEQIDALALAIWNAKKGESLVLGDQTGIGKGRVVAAFLRWGMAQRKASGEGTAPIFFTEKPNLYGDIYRDLVDIGIEEWLGRPLKMLMTNANEVVPMNREAVEWRKEVDELRAEKKAAREHNKEVEARKAAGTATEADKKVPIPRTKEPERRGIFLESEPPDPSIKVERVNKKTKEIETVPETAALAAERALKELVGGKRKDIDLVFTTYDQMNTRGDTVPYRRDAIKSLAASSIMALDESHTMSGDPKATRAKSTTENRARFMRTVLQNAKNVLYASATFASNPKAIGAYNRTGIRHLAETDEGVFDEERLENLIATAGDPGQQVTAATLSLSGQYIRRETSFDGIDYNAVEVDVDQGSYSEFSDRIRRVFQFDRMIEEWRDDFITDRLDELGAVQMIDRAVGVESANTIAFSSMMHNVVNQMTLAIKADSVATKAIQAVQEGRKPIIQLAWTMESFVNQMMELHNTKVGDVLDINFGDVIKAYLRRTLRITIRDSDLNTHHVYIPVDKMPQEYQDEYNEIEDLLNETIFTGLAISPIDQIRKRLKDADIDIKEITGRDKILDLSGNAPKIDNRNPSEKGTAGKIGSVSTFNNNPKTAIIMNEAGMTGLSLHSHPDFDDLAQREFIIAQASPSINKHMQGLGRVNRTGQVNQPLYTHVYANIPAEERPLAIIMKKMASLNANTTGGRQSRLMVDAVDFINFYGDRIIGQILAQDIELNSKLGMPLKFDDKGRPKLESIAQKATGRLILLDIEEQREFLDSIKDQYTELIKQLDEEGENKLEAKVIDYQAVTTETAVAAPPTGDNPFQAEVVLEKAEVIAPGRSLSAEGIINAIGETINKQYSGDPLSNIGQAREDAKEWAKAKMEATVKAADEWHERTVGGLKDEKLKAPHQERYAEAKNKFKFIMQSMAPGTLVKLNPVTVESGIDESKEIYGYVTEIRKASKTKDPMALGSWRVTINVPNSSVRIDQSMKSLYPKTPMDAFDPEPGDAGYVVKGARRSNADMFETFDEAAKQSKDTRYIFTGNVMKAYEMTKYSGNINFFTTNEGAIRAGLIMPLGFDATKFMENREFALPTTAHLKRFLTEAIIERAAGTVRGPTTQERLVSADDLIEIEAFQSGRDFRFYITIAAAKGKKYHTDEGVRRLIYMDKSGRDMQGYVGLDKIEGVIDALKKAGASFRARGNPRLAQRLINEFKGGDSIETMASLMPPARSPKIPTEDKPFLKTGGEFGNELIEAMADATKIIRRVAGPHIDIRFYSKNMNPNETISAQISAYNRMRQAAGFKAVDPEISGYYTSASVLNGEAVIGLSVRQRTKEGLKSTAAHEAFHHVQRALMTPEELSLLDREMPRLRPYAAAELGISSKTASKYTDIEIQAIAFQRWVREREEGQVLSGIHIGIRRLFERIYQLLQQVKNALAGHGFTSYEQIFESARKGEFAQRENKIREVINQDLDAPNTDLEPSPPTPGSTGMLASLTSPQHAGAPRGTPSGILNRLARRTTGKASNLTEWWRIGLQDRMLLWKKWRRRFEEESGTRLPQELDVYLSETLFSGRAGERLADLHHKVVDPLIEFLRENNITTEQLSDYMQARHAVERNVEIGRNYEPGEQFYDAMHNPDIVGASGWSQAEAETHLRDVRSSNKRAEYDQAAAMVDDMMEHTRLTLRRGRLISQDQYQKWTSTYQHYVPLRGWEVNEETPDNDFPHVGTGFDIRGPESKQAFGRRSKSDNSVAYAVLQAQQGIVRAEKNRVGRTLLRLVEAHPNSDLWRIHPGEFRKHTNTVTGKIESYYVPPQSIMGARAESIFAVKERRESPDGTSRIVTNYIEVKNPGMAKALRAVGFDKQNAVIRTMMTGARFFAALQTQWNPEFVVSNMARDIQTALINATGIDEVTDGVRRRIVKDAVSIRAIRGVMAAINSHEGRTIFGAKRDPDQTWIGTKRRRSAEQYATWFEEYRKAGGKVSFLDLNDLERIRNRVNTSMKQGNVSRAMRKAFRVVEDVNTSVENGVRLSLYIQLRKNGVSQNKAAFLAKELTVNFNRKGEWGPFLNSMYVFYNAATQGITRMLQAFKSPRVMKFVTGIVLAGAGMEFLNALIAGEDDDGENHYDKIPEWIKESNFILMLPGDSQGRRIQIPLPYGYNMFYILGLETAAAARGRRSALDAAHSVAMNTLNAFNPLGATASFAQWLSPTWTDPIVQILENKTWYGGPIQPKKFDKHKPSSENYYKSVNPGAREVAKFFNEYTGGNPGRSGMVDISPEVMEHITEFVGGGASRFILRTFKTGETIFDEGSEWLPEDTPILRRVYGKSTTASKRREFYEIWDKVDGVKHEVDELRKKKLRDELKDTLSERGDLYRVYKPMKKAQRALRKFRHLRDRIYADERLTERARRKKLDDLINRENAVISRALKAYNRIVNKE